MNENIRRFFVAEDLELPTTEECIKEVEIALGIVFPLEYKEFMLVSNGAEGSIGENSYLAIWNIEEIVELNEGYKVNEFNHGLVYFGSDGGGMTFAFDNRTKNTQVVTIPFEAINLEYLEPYGNTFYGFLQNLYNAE